MNNKQKRTSLVTVNGIVDKIAKNGTPFCQVDCNGSKHASFNLDVNRALKSKIGQPVSIVFEESGDYWNIIGLEDQETTNHDVSSHDVLGGIPLKDELIIAQCLTKCTTELVASGNFEGGSGAAFEEVLSWFKDFRSRINGH